MLTYAARYGSAAFSNASATPERRSVFRVVLATTAVFAAASLGVILATLSAYTSPGHGGWIITDVVTMDRSLTWLHEGAGIRDLPPGIVALYAWTWELTPALCGAVNIAVIWASTYLLADALRRSGVDPRYAAPAMLANPYLLLVAAGPNKDIPSLGLAMLILWLSIARPRIWVFWAFLAAAGEATIRDGFGVILALYVGAAALHRAPLFRAMAGIIVSWAASAVMPMLAEFYFVARNLEVPLTSTERGTAGLFGGLLDESTLPLLAYPLRLIYNAATNALFPVASMADGEWFPAGLAFWVFGVGLLVTTIACVDSVLRQRPSGPLGAFALFVLAGVSAAPFVQPRYVMAAYPAAVAAFLSLHRTRRWLMVIGTGLIVGAWIISYAVLGLLPAGARPEELYRMPAYLDAWVPG